MVEQSSPPRNRILLAGIIALLSSALNFIFFFSIHGSNISIKPDAAVWASGLLAISTIIYDYVLYPGGVVPPVYIHPVLKIFFKVAQVVLIASFLLSLFGRADSLLENNTFNQIRSISADFLDSFLTLFVFGFFLMGINCFKKYLKSN